MNKKLSVSLKILLLAFVVVHAYAYGRYVEIGKSLSYEMSTNAYDVFVAENTMQQIDSDSELAVKSLSDFVEFKKASMSVNQQVLDDDGYISFFLDMLLNVRL